jgi:hypothetical protein
MTWHSDFAESVNSNGKIALSQVISSGSFWPMPTRPGPQRNSSYLFCGKKMTQPAIRDGCLTSLATHPLKLLLLPAPGQAFFATSGAAQTGI